jgi:hypothetical protein
MKLPTIASGIDASGARFERLLLEAGIHAEADVMQACNFCETRQSYPQTHPHKHFSGRSGHANNRFRLLEVVSVASLVTC